MKKLWLALSLTGVLAGPTSHAALITLDYGQGTGTARGNYSVAGLGTTFDTFCLEGIEYFTPGGTYSAVFNPVGAVNGGVSGGNPDPISMGTAWLYSQFRAGTLTGYSGAGSVSALQNAIWWQEGEISADQSANPFIMLIPNAAWVGYNNTVNADGAWGVQALNITTTSGSVAQDQLGIVPEPTTVIAGALLLLPFGASTIRFLRKHRVA